MELVVNLPANAGDVRDMVSLGQEDHLEKEMATPPQYSCLENPMS